MTAEKCHSKQETGATEQVRAKRDLTAESLFQEKVDEVLELEKRDSERVKHWLRQP